MRYINIILAIIITSVLAACTDNTPDNSTPPPPVTVIAKHAGQNTFETKCVSCHGNDGTAGIGNAANLPASKLDSAAIIQVVTNGKSAMPGFKDQLTKEEIQNLASYILFLRQ